MQPRPTMWMPRDATAPRGAKRPRAQRLVGFLAFGGLALGVVIAVRDSGTERHRDPARGESLSTLAPIMHTGRPPQAGRSAKLKPTP